MLYPLADALYSVAVGMPISFPFEASPSMLLEDVAALSGISLESAFDIVPALKSFNSKTSLPFVDFYHYCTVIIIYIKCD